MRWVGRPALCSLALYSSLAVCSLAACSLAACTPRLTAPAPIAAGEARQTAEIGGVTLTLFTYRPAGCVPAAVMLVFHGVDRNAAEYRGFAEPLADHACAVVVAPLFDQARFPRDEYQYGGTADGTPGRRAIDLVAPLAAWARTQAGLPGATLLLLGHSAGAQFLDRVAAFAPTGAAAIIVANPSTWVEPTTANAPPFGLGGDRAGLRTYLGLPITVLLGTADTGRNNLAMTRAAMQQGANRHERGLRAFAAAQAASAAMQAPFGWSLAEVPGVGHSARAMFGSAQAAAAVDGALRRR